MKAPSERTIIFLVAAVQFVNVLDFMMVMPMGPDFAKALGIPTSNLGAIGGSYTAAAAVSGLVGSLFLDRFDRRKALAWAMAGLVLATAMGGFAFDLTTLIMARVLAGMFGGPATSIALSIVADVIPPERRGRAMGAVMGGFSVASVVGVPLGLELARRGSWRLPFFAVAAIGVLVTVSAIAMLPAMRSHLDAPRVGAAPSRLELLKNPTMLAAYGAMGLMMMSAFLVFPNFSAYLQENLGYPRARLGLLYLVGGALSFGVMRLTGVIVDRIGATRVSVFGAALFVATSAGFFLPSRPVLPILVLFVLFMLSGSVRNIALGTLSTRVPSPPERASYMSLQSAVQHLASAAGAFLSSRMLEERSSTDHALVGMSRVAWLSMTVAVGLLPLVAIVEVRLRKRATPDQVRSAA